MLEIQALAKRTESGTGDKELGIRNWDKRTRSLPILERRLSSSKLRARKLFARSDWVTLMIDCQAEESERRGHNLSRPVE